MHLRWAYEAEIEYGAASGVPIAYNRDMVSCSEWNNPTRSRKPCVYLRTQGHKLALCKRCASVHAKSIGVDDGLRERSLELSRAKRWKYLARRLRRELKAARAMNDGLMQGLVTITTRGHS